jgi:ABC-type lipoprotein release transport system permease subunit
MVFSNVLLVFLISLQFGMYGLMVDNGLKAFTGHMQVQAPGFLDEEKMRQTVPEILELSNTLRGELETDRVAARAQAFALASSEDRSYGVLVLGVEPAYEPVVSSVPGLVSRGRFLDSGDEASIVIGALLARNLKVTIGDELTLLGSGPDGSFAAAVVNVVGIFDTGIADLDRSIAELPIEYFQDVFYMRDSGHRIVINAAIVDAAPELETRVKALLADRDDVVVHDWDTLEPGLKQAIQADLSSSFFMYGMLAILVAFSVLNTQLMSVLERTREFGIVMSLGLKPGRLSRLVLIETAMMGVLGIVFGGIAGAAVTYWFSVNGFVYPGMEEMAAQFNLPARMYPQVSWMSVLIGPLVVFVFTMLAAVYPAVRLHWLKPVEAMRAA